MKVIVVSTNSLRGLQNANGDWLPGHRACVAVLTGLLEQRMAKGDFKLLIADLSDEATDIEFEKFLKESDGDLRLALESFESLYSNDEMKRETEEERAKRLKDIQEAADKAKKEAEDKAKAERDALEKGQGTNSQAPAPSPAPPAPAPAPAPADKPKN